MDPDDVMVFLFIGVALFVVISIVVMLAKAAKVASYRNAARQKQEALFQGSFPELQPHLHPEKVLQYVNARRGRTANAGKPWTNPPGFPAGSRAEFETVAKGEQTRILDAAGAAIAQFLYSDHPDGGVMRVGPGKLTANVRDAAVRYWHPQREFKWSRLKGWRVLTAASNREFSSSDRGTSFSSDSSSSSSTATTAAAAGAAAVAVAGAGGAFDGGGSSGAWDGAGDSRTSY